MEVVDLEVGGTKPGGGGLKFQGLDLGEILRIKEGSEEVGDTGVNTDNRVGGLECGGLDLQGALSDRHEGSGHRVE